MLTINLDNVEELIFYDREIQKRLPDLSPEFQQWQLGLQVPGLRQISRRAIFDTLNKLEQHLSVLEEYFKTIIVIDKLDYRVIKNGVLSIYEAENRLCEYEGFPNFCISRKGESVYLCFWR